jgi:hypothetical protein
MIEAKTEGKTTRATGKQPQEQQQQWVVVAKRRSSTAQIGAASVAIRE